MCRQPAYQMRIAQKHLPLLLMPWDMGCIAAIAVRQRGVCQTFSAALADVTTHFKNLMERAPSTCGHFLYPNEVEIDSIIIYICTLIILFAGKTTFQT